MAFISFYSWVTVLLLLFTRSFIFSNNAIIKDYIDYRINASCLYNTFICNNEILEDFYDKLEIGFMQESRCCSDCECDEGCFRRGDCCPDILSSNMTNTNNPLGGLYRCVPGRMRKKTETNYLMITMCLTNYTNLEIVKKCREDPTSGLDNFIPVSSNVSGDTYRNKYCAECNFEEPYSLTSWKIQLGCSSESFKKVKTNTLIADVLASADCDLYRIPPREVNVEKCTDVMDTCNQTGSWQIYDSNIVAGCELYRAPFYTKVYRNIFCYMCNIKYRENGFDCRRIDPPHHDITPPFSLLFDFNNVADVTQIEIKEDTCPVGTVYIALLDACYVIKCEAGFNYSDGQCIPSDDVFCMEAFLVLRPMVNISIHESSELQDAIETAINQTSLFPTDEFVWDVHRAGDSNFVFHLKFVFNITKAAGLLNFSRSVLNVTLLDEGYAFNTSSVFHIPFDFTLQDEVTGYLSYENHSENTTNHVLESFCKTSGEPYVFTQFTTCVWIEVELQYFDGPFSNEGLRFRESDFKLPKHSFVIIGADLESHNDSNDAVIKVCVDDIAGYTTSSQKGLSSEGQTSEAIGYLTLATSVLSIVSCLITTATYVLLKPLRTQPGVNNMALAITMFLGHVLFLFSSFHGNPYFACLFMGGLLHFLWLSVMFWYLVCSFHTFRVFHFSLLKPDNDVISTTLKYTLFVAGISLCFIAVNVTTSAVTSQNEDLGYTYNEGGLCWISTPILLGLTITLPALLSVVCNVVLFVIAVYKISTGIKADIRSNKNRQTFLIYIKLSVLTGITWLTVIPYIFTRIELFNYIFTCLNGLNGVFLFVAFLINKRVYLLYKSLVFGKDSQQESTTSLRTTRESASVRQSHHKTPPESRKRLAEDSTKENGSCFSNPTSQESDKYESQIKPEGNDRCEPNITSNQLDHSSTQDSIQEYDVFSDKDCFDEGKTTKQ